MSRSTYRTGFVAAGLALVCGLLAAPAAVAVDEEKRVEIRKIVRCDGEDCTEEIHEGGHRHKGRHQVMMLGDGHHGGMHHLGMHGGGTFLGVQLSELTPELRRHFGVPEDAGVMVSKVLDDSPASRAGVAVGDIISAVDGGAVASGRELARRIRGYDGGAAVNLEVWRGGSVQTLPATLEAREASAMAQRRIVIECEDGDDCGYGFDTDFDCGGAEQCEVQVECHDGGCECTVNGEATDCSEIPGVPSG